MRVKDFSDGSYAEYAPGKFDDWCVYITNPVKNTRRPPLDTDYFGFLKANSKKFGVQKIYEDFVSIYNLTSNKIEAKVLEHIDRLAAGYGEKCLEFNKVYVILYMGMVAEENKRYTRLGKRIKRLGMHVLLIDDFPTEVAANFMRNKKWREIDALCKERGF